MNRFDFLGVSGIGKSTTYNLLGQTRQNPNEFLLFNEAYDLALKSKLPRYLRFANEAQLALGAHRFLQPFSRPIGRLVNHEFAKVKRSFESGMLFEQLTGMWRDHRDMLFLRLNGASKHFITEQKIEPSEYLTVLLKTAYSMKQFNLLKGSLPEKTNVVIEKSFTQMVFFTADFSKDINPDIIFQYIRGIPLPAGVILFNAFPELIVNRLRQRVIEGRVATFHNNIIDTPLLEEWVGKACEIVRLARSCLLEQGVKIFDINAEEEPHILANNTREFMLGYRK